MLFARGGMKGALTCGATDELAMHAYSGRDFRIGDVHRRVAHDIIA